MTDNVNHPQHYLQYEHEVIELTEKLNFCIGNAAKYILRAPFKGHAVEDLEKARWYIEREIRAWSELDMLDRVPRRTNVEVQKLGETYGSRLLDAVLEMFSHPTIYESNKELVDNMLEKEILLYEIEALREEKAALEEDDLPEEDAFESLFGCPEHMVAPRCTGYNIKIIR